jgi:ankyrin repeat protein
MNEVFSRRFRFDFRSTTGQLRPILLSVIAVVASAPSVIARQAEPGAQCGTALIRAIDQHDSDAIETILKSAPNLGETACPEKTTALNEAIAERMPLIAERLMLAGADVNQTVGNGGTPLMTASWHCDDETASLLLKRGAHVNAQDLAGYSALMQATQMCSDGTVISMLLHAGANVNEHATDGSTALTVAAFYGNESAVKELVAAGADLEAKNASGETALTIARDRRIGRKPSHDRIYYFLKLLMG